jgi:hypothetical protein
MVCTPWYKAKESQGHSLKFMYNFRADPKLGLGRIAIRRIPCACAACRMQLGKPWVDNLEVEQQPRFQTNADCIFRDIFSGGLNDWHIVELAPGKDNDSEEVEEANRLVVKSWADRAEETIKEGENGAFQNRRPKRRWILPSTMAGAAISTSRILRIVRICPTDFRTQGRDCV